MAEIGIDTTELHLSVSKEESDVLYDTAGMLIKEDEHSITMKSHSNNFVHLVIQEVLMNIQFPSSYKTFNC